MVKQLSRKNEARTNDVFHMLADPTRRAILTRLGQGPARVTEVADPFDMSLPAISRHIRLMEKAGLLHRQVRGREHYLELNPEPLDRAAGLIQDLRSFWTRTLGSLDNYFDNNPKSRRASRPSKNKKNGRPHA